LTQAEIAAFRAGLTSLGWTEGQDLEIDLRFTAGDEQRLKAEAVQLVRNTPDLIVAHGNSPLVALGAETRTIPIVVLFFADPLASGFVGSLARPGGNVTGFVNFDPEMTSKWLELLKEINPQITRVVLMANPETSTYAAYLKLIEPLAPKFSVKIIGAPVRNETEVERVIAETAREPGGAVIMLPDAFTPLHQRPITQWLTQYRLPAVYPYRYWVEGGGLMSYGIDPVDQYRQAPSYVDRILKGARPGELPIQNPTKFEFVVNLKTAKTLGLTVPPVLLARADAVID
jgi:putative ABC transport system substrate-binding protein